MIKASSAAPATPGPKTPQGKKRSSLNALKHGIFSSAVVIKGESSTEFASVSRGLLEYFRPEGAMENLLVEKLAMLLWRHRRLVVAEGAEIQSNTEFLVWDRQNQQREEAEAIGSADSLESELGLMRKIQNPDVLDRILELLAELREGIEAHGFSSNRNTSILSKIYGEEAHLQETLFDDYTIWSGTAEASEEERQNEKLATPEQCKQYVLHAIDAEVRSLKRHQKAQAAVEARRTEVEVLRQGVPDSPSLDRLLRYEASLERAFDRTLSQLERLQRMRLGQSVLPPVRVEVAR